MRNADMPMPEPDETHDDYMTRCQDGGGSESECQMMWEKEMMPAARSKPKQLQIRMKTDGTPEVLLYDEIGEDPFFGLGISAKTFRSQIKALKAPRMNLRINSVGGSVFEASAMLAALDEWPGTIEVDIDGIAASAASVVAMGGNTIRMATNGMLMIHDPYGGVMGSADEMRGMASALDKAKSTILDAYARKSKVGREKLSAWMTAETWFTGQEAVDAGLATSVTAPVRIAALANAAVMLGKMKYRNTPKIPELDAAFIETQKRKEIAARWRG